MWRIADSGEISNSPHTRDGAPQIELIDGEQTCELLKDLKLGIKTEMVEHVSVVPEVFREFESGG
ncbi:hypothetical protein [Candidatus Binatus sp.]|uniref:hypothetical protein n=1 Tax=Candidatus Binatus sp. TaxID=2811406 RepID=UPI003C5D0D55